MLDEGANVRHEHEYAMWEAARLTARPATISPIYPENWLSLISLRAGDGRCGGLASLPLTVLSNEQQAATFQPALRNLTQVGIGLSIAMDSVFRAGTPLCWGFQTHEASWRKWSRPQSMQSMKRSGQ
jgi:hypothetical protein